MTEAKDMITQAFQLEWKRRHAGRQPFGPLLRGDDALPWVRFHSLPSSKRYAESDAERRIILDRANLLGDAFLGQAACWLVSSEPGDCEPSWAPGGQIVYDAGTDDERIVRYFVRQVAWDAGAFDALLLAVAEDDARYVWVSRDDGSVFAPYDGGFDLFAVAPAAIATLRAKWPEWLSSRPDGL
ncbi:MAG: hypothetical protein ACKVOB_14055 [Sphingomonas sp.]